MANDYDCSGWATKANLKCSDGRVIMKDAFKDNDGTRVPLCWGHNHDNPNRVLGHADLENRDEGVYARCKFNDTENGRTAKLLVQHGDVNALSIYANQLKQNLNNVIHGNIREVSLVLAGANPGAYIDSIMIHGEESDEEAIIYANQPIIMEQDNLTHENRGKKEEMKDEKKTTEGEETVGDVFDTLTEKQKTVVYAMIGQALKENEDEEDEEEDMKHNVFDTDERRKSDVLSHADQTDILNMAKKPQVGSFQNALQMYLDDNKLSHDAVSSGFTQTGDGNVTWLFPEYKDVRPGAPELITSDQGWISAVLRKVHKSPIARVRTSQVDIRNIDRLRAQGYKKGKQKK